MTDRAIRSQAWAGGSDAPEKSALDIGFMALTDSASLIVAATQGFAQPYGLTLNLRRQPSWATLRDKLLSGELDAAQCLYGLVYGVQLGLGGSAASEMAVLMGLCQNGQAINLSEPLKQAGVTSAEALLRHRRQNGARLTLAQTFPTGTHALWLNYWLASIGLHPLHDVHSVVVPPAQMVGHLQAGRIDGFCAGGPWGALAVDQGQGFTIATSQAIWPDHPEKVLGTTRAFVDAYPNTARALVMAVLDASRFIEQNAENRLGTAQLISGRDYVDAPLGAIQPRFFGRYQDGLGNAWQDPHPLRFYADGEVNRPWLSDGMWFMTQFRRWGLLREDPDYLGIARRVQQTALYRDAATALGLCLDGADMRRSTLIDGRLRAALLESGFEVVDESGLTIDLPARVEALRPDVILIDTESPGRDVMEQVCLVSRDQPRPIVMFTDEHDPGVMRRAIQSGVSAYIVEGIQASRLQPILDVAMARFESDQALRAQLQAREAQLAERKRIELAKGLLMKMKHCGEEEAYTLMRRQAMSRQQRLIQVAEQIIAMHDMLGG